MTYCSVSTFSATNRGLSSIVSVSFCSSVSTFSTICGSISTVYSINYTNVFKVLGTTCDIVSTVSGSPCEVFYNSVTICDSVPAFTQQCFNRFSRKLQQSYHGYSSNFASLSFWMNFNLIKLKN